MNKYLLVARNTWDETFTYRVNFVMYRLRNVLSLLTTYYLWYALLPAAGSTLFGYNQAAMLTYVLGTAVLQAFILASRSYAIGGDIHEGNLSNFLLRPINYFSYWFAKDLGDKAINICFACVELIILYIVLRPPLVIQTDPMYLSLFFVSVCVATVMYFLFNIVLGMVGFWSNEVWAPRFIFMILISFFSGGYFPLDVFPDPVYAFFSFLPFQYLLYFPLQIYLGKIELWTAVYEIIISLLWLGVLGLLVDHLWKRGLAVYTAQGR